MTTVHPITAKTYGAVSALRIALAHTRTSVRIEADAAALYAYIPADDLEVFYRAFGDIWLDADHSRAVVAGAYALLNQTGNHIARRAAISVA